MKITMGWLFEILGLLVLIAGIIAYALKTADPGMIFVGFNMGFILLIAGRIENKLDRIKEKK